MNQCFRNIKCFDVLDSSNDYLINLYKNYQSDELLTIYTDVQKKGRGRMGHGWFSGIGHGLTFSFSLEITNEINPFDVTMLTSYSIVCLLRHFDCEAYIKYPNDIIVGNQKIAGILTEKITNSISQYIIVGVGLNVNHQFFPNSLPDAVSMKQIMNRHFDKMKLFKSLIQIINDWMEVYSLNKQQLKSSYILNLHGFKEYVLCLYHGKRKYVKILSFTSDGFLSIHIKEAGVQIVNSRDIKFLLS